MDNSDPGKKRNASAEEQLLSYFLNKDKKAVDEFGKTESDMEVKLLASCNKNGDDEYTINQSLKSIF